MDPKEAPMPRPGALRRIKGMFNFGPKNAAEPVVKSLPDPTAETKPKYFTVFNKLGKTLSGRKIFKIGKPTFGASKHGSAIGESQHSLVKLSITTDSTGALKLEVAPCTEGPKVML